MLCDITFNILSHVIHTKVIFTEKGLDFRNKNNNVSGKKRKTYIYVLISFTIHEIMDFILNKICVRLKYTQNQWKRNTD